MATKRKSDELRQSEGQNVPLELREHYHHTRGLARAIDIQISVSRSTATFRTF